MRGDNVWRWQLLTDCGYIGARYWAHKWLTSARSFQMAHDSLGHFGVDKFVTHPSKRHINWPKMWREPEHARSYPHSFADCWETSRPHASSRPHLHPLPVSRTAWVPFNCMDFMDPCHWRRFSIAFYLIITDCIGSWVCIVPYKNYILADELAVVFFAHCAVKLDCQLILSVMG